MLTADPSRVHVLADLDGLLGGEDPQQWEPTDLSTGQTGQMVQSATCPL